MKCGSSLYSNFISENIATGIIAQLPISWSFIALLLAEKNNILIVKTSLRHWLQIQIFFITP
jgi:hypothetical protein